MVRALVEDMMERSGAKVRSELSAADELVEAPVAWSGSLFPAVALVKGELGPAELAGGAALSGVDGEAIEKALAALGITGATWSTVSRPLGRADDRAVASRLRQQVCAVDPAVVIALDSTASADLASAFGLGGLVFGEPVASCGATLLAVDGLEASLDDEARKRAVWAQLKGIHSRPSHPDDKRDARKRPVGQSLF